MIKTDEKQESPLTRKIWKKKKPTLTKIPVQYLDDYTGGVWIVYELNTSARVRFSMLHGDNNVLSAIMFDPVSRRWGGDYYDEYVELNLYVPRGWAHAVLNLETSVGVAVEFSSVLQEWVVYNG